MLINWNVGSRFDSRIAIGSIANNQPANQWTVIGLSGHFAIAAAYGTYNLSGYAASLLHASIISPTHGSYTYTGGTNNNLYHGRAVFPVQGSYTYTGYTTTLLKTKLISPTHGTYSLTGEAANLYHNR